MKYYFFDDVMSHKSVYEHFVENGIIDGNTMRQSVESILNWMILNELNANLDTLSCYSLWVYDGKDCRQIPRKEYEKLFITLANFR